MFFLQTSPVAAPAATFQVTNGSKGVTVVAAEVGHPMHTESVVLALTPDQSLLAGLSLILGGLNVQAGDHGNGGNALEVEQLTDDDRMYLLYAIAARAQTARANYHSESARAMREHAARRVQS